MAGSRVEFVHLLVDDGGVHLGPGPVDGSLDDRDVPVGRDMACSGRSGRAS